MVADFPKDLGTTKIGGKRRQFGAASKVIDKVLGEALGGIHPYIRPKPHEHWGLFTFHPYIP